MSRQVRYLVASGVPVLGEAGVGYALPRGYDLPPLMFTEEEVEALVLGARAVRTWGAGLGELRSAIRDRLKVRMSYADRAGAASQRTVWPLGLFDHYPVESGRTIGDLMRHYQDQAPQRGDGPEGAD